MNNDIRKDIDKFKEFIIKEVIISYDCSDIHNPFCAELLDLLKNKYEAIFITKSNYKLKEELSSSEIEVIKTEIKNIFEDSKSLTEGNQIKQTIVKLIIPNNSKFDIVEIINEVD